jgi:hypothetical protein
MSSTIRMANESKDSQSKSRCCICLCVVTCIVCVTLIISSLLIALLIYYFMPRIPDVRTAFNSVSITKFDVATTSLELNINMTISVTNANPYDISMSSLKLNVFERTSNTLYGIATYPATVVFDSGTTTARTLSLSYTQYY